MVKRVEKESVSDNLIRDITTVAIKEHPDLTDYTSYDGLTGIVKNAVEEVKILKDAAYQPHLPQTPKEAQHLKAIWVISSIGTYDEEFKLNDPPIYRKPMFGWMNRRRLNYAGWLVRRYTEKIIEQSLDGINDQDSMKQAIAEFGPWLIYNGNQQENENLVAVLGRREISIPPEKVYIIENPQIAKTIDQVRTFELPQGLELNESDFVGIVCHDGQMMRLLHFLNRQDNLIYDQRVNIKVFPLPLAKEEYLKQEVIGLLFYIFKSHPQLASLKPYPFEI